MCDVNFTYAVEEWSVLVNLKYQERVISLEKFPGVKKPIARAYYLADKVRFVLSFVDKSPICPGFLCDIRDDTPLSDSYVAHSVLDMTDPVKVPSKRFFSSKYPNFDRLLKNGRWLLYKVYNGKTSAGKN